VRLITLIALLLLPAGLSRPQSDVAPAAVGMSAERLADIGPAVREEIRKGQLPGAVVLIGRQGKIVFREAYGQRALLPSPEAMTVDTIFDLASLTKVVATATSVMILAEHGKLRLGDPVARYIPEFGESGKKNITVEHLLVHRSGLMPDNDISDYKEGPEHAFANIWKLPPIAETGSRFIYSDVNYIVLGELVKRVSGMPLDVFASENIYKPLGMRDTGFKPAEMLRPRIAPTEQRGSDEHWMRGEVHDPRAFALGGVAGHAGLFSTAGDLAIFCQMMINQGQYHGVSVLSLLGVARMTEARLTAGNATDGAARGIGWDIATGYSSNRGDLFPVGSYGHTGFTGTSIWIDPASETFVVFLSNRVHPKVDPKQPTDVNSLRGRVASIAASAIVAPPYSASAEVLAQRNERLTFPATAPRPSRAIALNGIDVLERDGFAQLKGKRVGLITNQTGLDREGRSTIDLLNKAPGVKLVALFSPEHGIRGVFDSKVENSVDEKTGLTVYSLYGEQRQPTPAMLSGIDTLVYDIQDVGARFYTYISTLGLALEAAGKAGIRFVVLDRVNPINGSDLEGPVADGASLSFTAFHQLPVRHGMTVGELARLFNEERGVHAQLDVVQVEGWHRSEWFDETDLTWVNPSPNMRSLTEATLYPGIGLLETTNVSVGRGTDTPFELVGAPWLEGAKLAKALNDAALPGVSFVPVRFTPRSSVHEGVECRGVNILITDRARIEPVTVGLEIAAQLLKLHPKAFEADKINRLLVNQKVLGALKLGADGRAMKQVWEQDLNNFRGVRRKYLLY
jgi:uncharacterized protein YbbC (DUF1343 family)/CubicO group peptidase (beta-lactamase class C family)